MKRAFPLVFALVAVAACTPVQLDAYNQLYNTDHPLPPVVSGTDRDEMMSLPETLVTALECGNERNVIAWFTDRGEEMGAFVYEDEAGDRWILYGDGNGCGYHGLLTDEVCRYDVFLGLRSLDCPQPSFDLDRPDPYR